MAMSMCGISTVRPDVKSSVGLKGIPAAFFVEYNL